MLNTLAQHVYPQRMLSKMMYKATRIGLPAWKDWQIRWFVNRYQVDLTQVAEQDLTAFSHFNAFFTRALVADARPQPLSPSELTSPADGVLSQFGDIRKGRIIQAKGQLLSVEELLAGQGSASHTCFSSGKFFTVYLSPRDYHRVHMPQAGRLAKMQHVPGRLFSVNPASAQTIRALFARNERVVSLFHTPFGAMAVILVGALFVGSIEQVWCGTVTQETRVDDAVELKRGQEMGRFNMGSTVIVLLENARWQWDEILQTGAPLRVGQPLAHLASS